MVVVLEGTIVVGAVAAAVVVVLLVVVVVVAAVLVVVLVVVIGTGDGGTGGAVGVSAMGEGTLEEFYNTHTDRQTWLYIHTYIHPYTIHSYIQ